MGTCICCGAETAGDLKLCKACDDTVRNNPCRGCTEAMGRKLGCHDTCERRGWWLFCHLAVKKLQSDQAAIRRPTVRSGYRKGRYKKNYKL